MSVTSTTAKQLCTKAELDLFTESLARNVKLFDDKALRSRVTRSRRLRDKYRQLADRQDREARGKQTPRRRRPSRGSVATRKKEQLLGETLTRFEKRLAKVETVNRKRAVKPTPTTRSVKKPVAVKKAATTRKPTVKKKAAVKRGTIAELPVSKIHVKIRVRKSAAQKKAAVIAKKARLTASGLSRRVRHLTAATRRQQARRDTR